MANPATTTPTAVKVPATAGVLCKNPDDPPLAESDGVDVSTTAPPVFVTSGTLFEASRVVGDWKLGGLTLSVVCETFGIKTTDSVELEAIDELLEGVVELSVVLEGVDAGVVSDEEEVEVGVKSDEEVL